MKFVNSLFSLLFLLVCFSCQKQTIEIYVAENGNDTASGDKNSPVKSIQKARDLSVALKKKGPVNIIFEDGTYYLSGPVIFEAEHSGSKQNYITYQAANEGKAVISGGTLLDLNWELHQDGIYKTKTPEGLLNIDQLYVNGNNQRMARFPNAIAGKNVFDTWDRFL
jgi:hypothetical protein